MHPHRVPCQDRNCSWKQRFIFEAAVTGALTPVPIRESPTWNKHVLTGHPFIQCTCLSQVSSRECIFKNKIWHWHSYHISVWTARKIPCFVKHCLPSGKAGKVLLWLNEKGPAKLCIPGKSEIRGQKYRKSPTCKRFSRVSPWAKGSSKTQLYALGSA